MYHSVMHKSIWSYYPSLTVRIIETKLLMWTKSTYKRELEEKYVIKCFLICDLKICNTFINKLWKALLADSSNRRHKNYLWIFKGSWYWYQSWKSSIQRTEYCIRDVLPNPHISLASKCLNETSKQSLSNQSDTLDQSLK